MEFPHWLQYCHGLHIPPTWFAFFLNLNIYWYHLLLHVLCFVCVAFISSFICSFYFQFFIHFSFGVLLTCLGKNVFMRHYCFTHCIYLYILLKGVADIFCGKVDNKISTCKLEHHALCTQNFNQIAKFSTLGVCSSLSDKAVLLFCLGRTAMFMLYHYQL